MSARSRCTVPACTPAQPIQAVNGAMRTASRRSCGRKTSEAAMPASANRRVQ